ncbi:MAG: flagellar hook-associated protein FlgK [Rhodobacteraceae bacterium]|nr:flagellar hook-associated protein FlgK [Paracoccaceae bacterium]
MSISAAISNAYSGLTAVSRRAETVSSNVANALNENYTRREVMTAERVIGGTGSGVKIDSIFRAVDVLATSQRRATGAELGNSALKSDAMTRMAEMLGQPGDARALATQVLQLENSMRAAADAPQSEALRSNLLSDASGLANSLNSISTQTSAVRMEADATIARHVQTVNSALKQIEAVNTEIRIRGSGSNDTAALMDERARLIDKISDLIPVRLISRDKGEVALYSQNGAALIDGAANVLEFSPTPVITHDMTLASTALSGISINGRPITMGSGAGQLDGGALSAAFEVRDVIAPEFNSRIDAMAQDIVDRFQNPATDPSLAPGAAGLFTDNGAAFLPADTLGLAGRIDINALVDPAQGGDLWRLRDGIGAVAPGPAGDDSQLRRMVDAMTAQLVPGAGTGVITLSSATSLAAGITSIVAGNASRQEDQTAYQMGQFDILREGELAMTGVDTDYEMQQLLLVEQAYAANARVISTADMMMQTLLEI